MSGNPLLRPAVLVAAGVMVVAAVGMAGAISAYGMHLRKLAIYPADGRVVSSIPTETEHWERVGIDRVESAEIVEVLGTDNYLNRMYRLKASEAGEPPVFVDFHLAYYTGKIDTVPHIPERCFVGGGLVIGQMHGEVPLPLNRDGWQVDPEASAIAGQDIFTVRLSNRFSDRPGTRVRLPANAEDTRLRISEFTNQAGRGQMFAGYMFLTNGTIAASAEAVRRHSFDLQQDYAYYLKIQFTSNTVENAEDLAAKAALLMDDLYGEIMRTAPDWIEVQAGRYPPDRTGTPEHAGN